MKFSILISNYNYGRYLRESVESVLAQSYPAHEIVIVDDGSTDDSLEILREHYGSNPKVRIVSQLNKGHAAAIGRAIECATGEVVCLLDSDDRYKREYLAELKPHYSKHPHVDVTFCRLDSFGDANDRTTNHNNIWLNPQRDYNYGYSALLTAIGNYYWIGNLCSTISLRIRLARTLRLDEAARRFYLASRGDFCLLAAASLLGARKFYLHKTLVEYRVHPVSLTSASKAHPELRYQERIAFWNWSHYYKEISGITDRMYAQLYDELKTVPDPLPEHLAAYHHVYKTMHDRFFPNPNISRLKMLERRFRMFRKRFTS